MDDMPRIAAAFILSGATSQDSLDAGLAWYGSLVEQIRNFRFDPFDRVGSAAKTFAYLHSAWLCQYNRGSTTLLDIMGKKQFNCVSATILYNLICEDMGWSTEAFETPTHVYTVFTNFTQNVMVENTTPMGFDIMKNLKQYSQFLLQYYPQNRALQIGLDRLYVHEHSRGRPIDNTELLGLLAYNRAYQMEGRGDYESAYGMVLLAQLFNADSRSNIDFEIGLFHQWGETLFQSKQYSEAYGVYVLGGKRHPEVGGFRTNARAAFLNGLHLSWNEKNWEESRLLLRSCTDLSAFGENDLQVLQSVLQNWTVFLVQGGRSEEAKEAFGFLERFKFRNSTESP